MIGKHPNWPFCGSIWGDECWDNELEKREDNLYGEIVRAKSRESAPLTVGSERRTS